MLAASSSPAPRSLVMHCMGRRRRCWMRPATRPLMVWRSRWPRHEWLVETGQARIREFSSRIKKYSSVEIRNSRWLAVANIRIKGSATPHAALPPGRKHGSVRRNHRTDGRLFATSVLFEGVLPGKTF